MNPLAFLFGFGLVLLIATTAKASPKKSTFFVRGKKMSPQERENSMKRALSIVQQLAPQFDPPVPLDLAAAIMHIESDFNPTLVNMSPNARKRGNAWGIGQVTLLTAKDYADRFPQLGEKFWPKFDGTGESLKDPITNIGFMLAHLSRSLKMFDGDWYKAGTAYHQGNGTIKKLVAQYGDDWANHLATNGARYHAHLMQKRRAYQQAPGTPEPNVAPVVSNLGELDGTGAGGGGGGECPRPTNPTPPTET